ncbi:MAG: aldehyde dehydrogenase family protein [Oscillospiraceae bacterium]|nr:aldehyde dehydrogenase family protein [Oscillospiraceae bacterium]
MDAVAYVNELVERGRAAQKIAEGFTQEQVDAMAKAMAKVIFDHAEELSRLCVDETRMGVYEDKVNKCRGKARVIWTDVKGKKTVGVIRELPELGLVEVAKPMGVVGAVTPTTNPVVTPMCNAMFCIKGRNAIIVCPHPRAKKCTLLACQYMQAELVKLGAPADLFQCVEEPTMEISQQIMRQCDVCISTGGGGMVKAAYASGKPAFGVGAGNVQCIIDRDVDLEKAVPMIIAGRIFDNGIICSGEQTAITPAEKYNEMVRLFQANGAYYVEKPEEVDRLRETIFPGGVMNKDCVGQSAKKVAEMAGLPVPENVRVLLVKVEKSGFGEAYANEKMCPVIAAYRYDTWEDAVAIAAANLEVKGKGHSVCIHSNNDEHIRYAANVLPVSRFLINQICATNNGGSFFNSLSATTTLGCGSWGNNSISENLSWKHLINVSRIAKVRPGSYMPTDEEIWA